MAAALAATVVAQRSDRPPDRAADRAPERAPERPSDRSERRRADMDRPPSRGGDRPAEAAADGAPPPGMGPETKLEWLMLRPGRVKVREAWNVGRVECRPWDAGPNAEKAFVRVNALIIRDERDANDKAAGVELVLEAEDRAQTFFFDAEQVQDVLGALDALEAAAQRLREPGQGATRRAAWTLNGLEIGMNPRRTGGYLAPMAPDERSTGLSPDDFNQLRRLLQEARDLLGREGR
jgi:hypothetical protein